MNEEVSGEDMSTRENEPESVPMKPLVFRLKRKKRRKRRYSRGMKEMQVMERRLSKSARRMASAAEKGMSSYLKRSKRSSRRKRDGALRDFIPNTAWGMSRAMREASPIPYEIARAMTPRGTGRWATRQMRMALRTWRAWQRS